MNQVLKYVTDKTSQMVNKESRSLEILMFVCWQKDDKKCCDYANLDCTRAGRLTENRNVYRTEMCISGLCGTTELFGVFYKTNIKIP